MADHHRPKHQRKPRKKPAVRKDLVREAEKQLTEEEKQCILNRRHAEEQAQSIHQEKPPGKIFDNR
jgi:hypothetical protein